jgi:kynurenine 3-monooxygenase
MRKTRMNYSQEYINHGYVELCIPPNSSGDYAMDPNHLHIWPRHTFMMIALPNPDASFTVTLFMPWEKFDAIRTETDLLEFFDAHFPDSVALMGKEFLISEYFKNPKGSLISIKCKPYHYKSSCVILGDAAHAMVPFYGQGMNCGFEDVETFFKLLNAHFQEDAEAIARPSSSSLSVLLNRYSETRHPDASSMCDLAMYNYIEMRSSVVSTSYLLRKKIDNVLNYFFPKQWIPLYTMVSFSNIRYSEVVKREERQKSAVVGAVNTFKWSLYGTLGFVAGAMWLRYAGVKNICWVVEQSGSKIGKFVMG